MKKIYSFFNLKAHNFMLLSEPKNSKIVKPHLKLVDVKQVAHDIFTNRYIYNIEMSSEAVAPFVCMDSKISGQFLDNGFFMFSSSKTIQFETYSNITVQHFKDSLTFKTLTDVI